MQNMVGYSNHDVIVFVVYMLMFVAVRLYCDCSSEHNLVSAHICSLG
jgi:hypothetical protein